MEIKLVAFLGIFIGAGIMWLVGVLRRKPTPKITIEVCERLADAWYDHEGRRKPKYHAKFKTDTETGVWACGRTPYEAVGDLIYHAREDFVIEYLGRQAR
jgi:hypothetical protein